MNTKLTVGLTMALLATMAAVPAAAMTEIMLGFCALLAMVAVSATVTNPTTTMNYIFTTRSGARGAADQLPCGTGLGSPFSLNPATVARLSGPSSLEKPRWNTPGRHTASMLTANIGPGSMGCLRPD